MGSYEKMKKRLEQTGIYSVSDDSNISKEISAYSEGLDSVSDELDTLLRECFISSAESFGITMRESFIGRERCDRTLSQRRDTLIAEEQKAGKCTPAGFVTVLKGYGLQKFSITESYSTETVKVTVYDSLSDTEKEEIELRAECDFPLHLNVEFAYS